MFNWKKGCQKKLLQLKDLNIRHQEVSLKKKVTLQKKQYNGLNKVHRFDTKDDEIKNKKTTLKTMKNQIHSTAIYLILTNFMICIRLTTFLLTKNNNLAGFHQDLNSLSNVKA